MLDEKLTLENKLCSYLTLELKPGDLASLGRAFASLYNYDSSGLIAALGKCCDLLRSKDDSSSHSTRRYVPCIVLFTNPVSPVSPRMAVLCILYELLCRNVLHVVGCLYAQCGQAGGAAFVEVVQTLSKLLRNMEV